MVSDCFSRGSAINKGTTRGGPGTGMTSSSAEVARGAPLWLLPPAGRLPGTIWVLGRRLSDLGGCQGLKGGPFQQRPYHGFHRSVCIYESSRHRQIMTTSAPQPPIPLLLSRVRSVVRPAIGTIQLRYRPHSHIFHYSDKLV